MFSKQGCIAGKRQSGGAKESGVVPLAAYRALDTLKPENHVLKFIGQKKIPLDGFQGLDAPDDHLRFSWAFSSAT